MMNLHYILDEQGNPVFEPNYIEWARWYETAERHIGDTTLGDIRISTVFLSLPHVSKEIGNDNMMLYETMVFADEATLKRLLELAETDDRSIFSQVFGGIDIQKRYATRSEALQGHKNMCIFIETCLTNGLLAQPSYDEPLIDYPRNNEP